MKKEKVTGDSMRCRSLDEAREILYEKGIRFDNIYENIYSKKNVYGIESGVKGVHAYINNGDKVNVAYWTPMIDTLTIINEGRGRIDASDNRHYIWRKEK